MYIIGLSCFYHDSSACIIRDGNLIAAAEEERFTRIKHDVSFPINALNYCLKEAKITISEVNYIAFYEKPLLKFERILSQHLDKFPFSLPTFINSLPSWLNEKLRLPSILRKKLKYNGDIIFVQHHMAHAASSFLICPFKEAAILTIDGVGEWTTTAYGVGKGSNIKLEKHIQFPHSLGLLYSTITAYLGFSVNNSEYKVMGLSAYGNQDRNTNPFYTKLSKIIAVKEDGSFHLDMSYFVYHYKASMPSKKLCKLLGNPISNRDAAMMQHHKDIAAALQLITEDVITKILNNIYTLYETKNLVLAGGVALNSVYNGKILSNTPFKDIWIQPNASDGGTSIGAAYYLYNTILNNPRNFQLNNVYLGPGYTNAAIKDFLLDNKIKFSEFKDKKDLIKNIAKLIQENNVIGWFHGRMEFGPRALGSRSILSNPTNPKMQEILNIKVKHREKFRPFAPVVCREDANKYFECDSPLPLPTDYMLMVYPIKTKYHKIIPAVTHIDGSGRLQTVSKEQNHLYYKVIKEFGKLTGIPILINTSFNIRGEPIVCTPFDAYKCMMGTGIDYLSIGNFLIKRSDNPKDLWNSEELCID